MLLFEIYFEFGVSVVVTLTAKSTTNQTLLVWNMQDSNLWNGAERKEGIELRYLHCKS